MVIGSGHVVLNLISFRNPKGLNGRGVHCDKSSACDVLLLGCISINALSKTSKMCTAQYFGTEKYDNQNNIDYHGEGVEFCFNIWMVSFISYSALHYQQS